MEHCYLLHFSAPVSHARHYLGTTNDLRQRLQLHRSGRSRAKLIDTAVSQGITLQLVRVWPGDWGMERRLKNRKEGPTLCPICNPRARVGEDERALIARMEGEKWQ
jgi:hypothetical protein